MKENIIYNRPDNEVMMKSNKDFIIIICRNEEQVQPVMNRMNTDTCYLSDYEEWDEGKDMKWILTFKITDEYEQLPEKN